MISRVKVCQACSLPIRLLLTLHTSSTEVTLADVTYRFEEEEYRLQLRNDVNIPRGRVAFLLEGLAIQVEQ